MDVVAQPLSKNATWQKDKKEEATVSSEAEQNKTLVRRLFEARGKLDMDVLDKMLAPHFLSHTLRCFPASNSTVKGSSGRPSSIMPPFPTPASCSRSR